MRNSQLAMTVMPCVPSIGYLWLVISDTEDNEYSDIEVKSGWLTEGGPELIIINQNNLPMKMKHSSSVWFATLFWCLPALFVPFMQSLLPCWLQYMWIWMSYRSVSVGRGKPFSVFSVPSDFHIYCGMYFQSFIFVGKLLHII